MNRRDGFELHSQAEVTVTPDTTEAGRGGGSDGRTRSVYGAINGSTCCCRPGHSVLMDPLPKHLCAKGLRNCSARPLRKTCTTSLLVRTTRGTDLKWTTGLWIIVAFCIVTFPQVAEGFNVSVPESVNASAGEPTTIPCSYTDKQGAVNGASSEQTTITWKRTFSGNSEESVIIKTGQSITGKWYDEQRATVVDQASLRIFKVSGRDAGKYTCVVGTSQGTAQLFVDEKPKIQADFSELILSRGKTLTLTCVGADRLTWEWPRHDGQNVTFSTWQNHSLGQLTSVLRIEQVSIEDTGQYQCVHSISGEDGTWKSEPVYVYVTSEDSLFLEADQTDLVHFWDEPSVIPCRVTNPNANVTLLPPEKFPLLPSENFTSNETSAEVSYDPKRGFIVGAESLDYSGSVSCVAVLGNETDIQSFMVDFVGRPHLSEEGQKTISENDTLELVCTGSQPMRWYTPSGLANRLLIRNTHSYTSFRPASYKSVLRLSNLRSSDTGEYACKYERYDKFDRAQLKSSVYIFVRSADPQQIFVPPPDLFIFVKTEFEPITVPCRVSDPNVADLVQLNAFYTDTTQAIPGFNEKWNVTFDPRVGFKVKKTANSVPIRKLTVTCSILEYSGYPDVNTVTFQVRREGESQDNLFQAEFLPSAPQLVQGDGPFNVTCKIVFPYFFYPRWVQARKPKMAFEFPNKDIVIIRPKLEILEGIINLQVSFTASQTIKKVSVTDSGVYSCTISNIELSGLTLNTSLKVLEKGYVKLRHYPPGQEAIEGVEGQEEICFKVLVESFPKAGYQWSKDGVNQTNQTAPYFAVFEEQIHVDNKTVVSGCITNLTTADSGSYSLQATNEYETSTISINLSVLEIPQVNLTVTPQPSYQDPPLYYTRQSYRIICHAWGFPAPQISWQWRECPDDLCSADTVEGDEEGWNPIESKLWASASDDATIIPDRMVESVLEVQEPLRSVIFRCLAQSPSEKIQEAAYELLEYRLTDFKVVLPPPQEVKSVYTNNWTELTCMTNNYAFAEDVVWEWIPSGNTSEPVSITEDDERVSKPDYVPMTYHTTTVLTINRASLNDSGVYRCLAQQRSTGDHLVVYEVQLNVQEAVPPVITKELQETYSLDRKKKVPRDFRLECRATGDPLPTLHWYKDGHRINEENDTVANVETYRDGKSMVISKLSLHRDVSDAQGGTYECRVKNSGGLNVSRGRILIGESPTAKIEDEFFSKYVGDNLTIACRTTGKPPPVITWKKIPIGTNEERNVPSHMYDNSERVLVFRELQDADGGKYVCFARNSLGNDSDTVTLAINTSHYAPLMFLLPIGIIAVVIFLLLLFCLIAMAKRLRRLARKAKRNSQNMELGLVNPRSPRTPMSPFRMSFREEFSDQLSFDSKWEFPRDRLKLGAIIGQGAFGMVLKGVAAGISKNERYVPVAVKTVKSDASYADRKALFGELKMLIHVGHHLNVVNFLGACTQDSPPLVIVEFCPYGNLCDYLRSKRDKFQLVKSPKSEQEENKENELNYADLLLREACVSEPPAAEYELVDKEAKRVAEKVLTVEDLVCFCFQVARGMEFLASRKCIHRDLAARNVLLGENNVVKICDFGLSRSFYHDSDYIGSGKGLLPIKWMAPEAIFDKVFTTYSDIWSYGVFIWEVFSLGGSPYPGVQVDEKFYDKMKAGYRMSCPEHAPREVYQLMLECWSDEPKDRPMFSELAEQFGEQLESNTRQEYIDLNIPYQEGQYCELDFGKLAAKKKPETVFEENETVQPPSDDRANEGPAEGHFDDPTYHRGPRIDQSDDSNQSPSAESCQPLLVSQEACDSAQPTPGPDADEPFPTNGYATIQGASGPESRGSTKSSVQLPESLPDDPYQRGPDEQLHTYTSVKGTRPGLNTDNTSTNSVKSCSENKPCNLSSPDDENRIHTYASIKGSRPDRTTDKFSPTDPDKDLDRNHLYSSIKGSRPNATIPGLTLKVRPEEEGRSIATEGTSLLGKPKLPDRDVQSFSLGRTPDGKFRLQTPPLPKRDFSTSSWSPERETLLSGSDSQDTDPKCQPVCV